MLGVGYSGQLKLMMYEIFKSKHSVIKISSPYVHKASFEVKSMVFPKTCATYHLFLWATVKHETKVRQVKNSHASKGQICDYHTRVQL